MNSLRAALRDLMHVLVAPGALFARLPLQHRSLLPCLILISLEIIISFGVVSTGVVDHEIDVNAERDWKPSPGDPESPVEREQQRASAVEKQKIFNKRIARVRLYGGRALLLVVEVGLLMVPLFGAVALRGGKPNLPLLAEVGVWAHFAEVGRRLFCLWLVAQLQVTRIETSAAALVNTPAVGLAAYILLRRLDPFVLWYWLLVMLGVWKTRQLRLYEAIILVVVLATACGLFQCVMDVFELAEWSVN